MDHRPVHRVAHSDSPRRRTGAIPSHPCAPPWRLTLRDPGPSGRCGDSITGHPSSRSPRDGAPRRVDRSPLVHRDPDQPRSARAPPTARPRLRPPIRPQPRYPFRHVPHPPRLGLGHARGAFARRGRAVRGGGAAGGRGGDPRGPRGRGRERARGGGRARRGQGAPGGGTARRRAGDRLGPGAGAPRRRARQARNAAGGRRSPAGPFGRRAPPDLGRRRLRGGPPRVAPRRGGAAEHGDPVRGLARRLCRAPLGGGAQQPPAPTSWKGRARGCSRASTATGSPPWACRFCRSSAGSCGAGRSRDERSCAARRRDRPPGGPQPLARAVRTLAEVAGPARPLRADRGRARAAGGGPARLARPRVSGCQRDGAAQGGRARAGLPRLRPRRDHRRGQYAHLRGERHPRRQHRRPRLPGEPARGRAGLGSGPRPRRRAGRGAGPRARC